MSAAPSQAIEKMQRLSVADLCQAFEQTNDMQGGHVPALRGWLMDELERRDQAAFDAWMETDCRESVDYPSRFFNKAAR